MPNTSFTKIIKDWWWFIGLCTIILVVCASLVVFNQPDKYISALKILVNQGSKASLVSIYNNVSADRSVKTVGALVKNESVLNEITNKIGSTNQKELYESVSVKYLPETQLIQINVINRDPDLTQSVAKEIEPTLSKLLDKLQAETDVENQIKISVAEAPSLPTILDPMWRIKTIMMVLLISLFAAYAIAYLLEYFDRSVKDIDDLEKFKLVHLGNFGLLEKKNHWVSTSKNHSLIEMIREIRTNISFIGSDKNIKSLVVTSANPREGKTLFVANLSLMLAEAGKRIIVVDADLKSPFIHKIFKCDNEVGLSDYLSDKQDLSKIIRKTSVDHLSIITAGKLLGNRDEMIKVEKLEKLTKELLGKEKFDLVLFDAPPVGLLADAATISQVVDGTILIVEKNKTTLNDLEKIIEAMKKVKANVLGAVFTKVKDNKKIYYYSNRK